MTFKDLYQQAATYIKTEKLEQLRAAYTFAETAHQGQKRVSGEPYITHPLGVAHILAELELDLETLVAALLHDVVEDTRTTLEDVEREFGEEIALLVDGVTKLGRLKEKTKTEQQAENLRKMFLAMARDIRVVLIKLADRLHNMRTLQYLPLSKQQEVASETLEIFAPLAHRLGISRIQWELEDLAFRYLEPRRYQEIARRVARKRSEREQIIAEAIRTLKSALDEMGIAADIQGRPKHFYSIYRKMKGKHKDFSEIYDLTAIRVLVESVKDCYGVLGVVHTMWKPIPGRFKDYIAMPKPNMYQSLHTTVIGVRGEPIEIQIRTWEMHQTAEYGIAAHWRYKEGTVRDPDFEEKLAWLRQILEWQQELRDAEEFMDSLKIEVFADQVFVFTPKGDVIDLPAGATPIDFAYRIHTQVGHRCIGAKANGRIVPLYYKLQNGDIVEILTSKVANGPSRDWLNIVKTSSAKSRIRQWFKRQQREENIERGRILLDREIQKLGYTTSDVTTKDDTVVAEILEELNYVAYDDLLAAIGFGNESAASIANKLVDKYKEIFEPETALEEELLLENEQLEVVQPKGVRVSGVDNALISLAKCCNPVPGDDIIGFVTRGRGVSIHLRDCPNVQRIMQTEPQRLIEVEWEQSEERRFPVRLQITGKDRPGLLHDVMAVLSERRINIISFHAKTDIHHNAIVLMTVEVADAPELKKLMKSINQLDDIYTVHRLRKG